MEDMRYDAFLSAVVNQDVEKVKCYIQMGLSVNCRSKNGEGLLAICCKNGNSEIAQLLVNNNVNLTVLEENNESYLYLACKSNNITLVKLFIKSNVSPLINSADNKSCLEWACDYNNREMIIELLSYCKSKSYELPANQLQHVLVWSVVNRHVEITKIVLDKINFESLTTNECLLSIATKNEDNEMITLLLSHGFTEKICETAVCDAEQVQLVEPVFTEVVEADENPLEEVVESPIETVEIVETTVEIVEIVEVVETTVEEVVELVVVEKPVEEIVEPVEEIVEGVKTPVEEVVEPVEEIVEVAETPVEESVVEPVDLVETNVEDIEEEDIQENEEKTPKPKKKRGPRKKKST
jgi:hypothetical protein